LRLSLALILTVFVSVGCTQIPQTPAYSPSLGRKTCNDIARSANDRATEQFVAGTVIAVAGVTGVGAGIAMGPDTDPRAEWHERSRYLMVLIPGAVIAGLGAATLFQARGTEQLARRTALAASEKEDDRFIYYQCVKARDDWADDHTDSTHVQIELMKEAMNGSAAAQETASSARVQSQSATSVAIDARTNALRATQVATASAEETRDLASMAEKMIEPAPAPAPPPPKNGASKVAPPPKSAPPPKTASAPPVEPLPAAQRPPSREMKPPADAKVPPNPPTRPANLPILNEQH
jgi:hypothetical protein